MSMIKAIIDSTNSTGPERTGSPAPAPTTNPNLGTGQRTSFGSSSSLNNQRSSKMRELSASPIISLDIQPPAAEQARVQEQAKTKNLSTDEKFVQAALQDPSIFKAFIMNPQLGTVLFAAFGLDEAAKTLLNRMSPLVHDSEKQIAVNKFGELYDVVRAEIGRDPNKSLFRQKLGEFGASDLYDMTRANVLGNTEAEDKIRGHILDKQADDSTVEDLRVRVAKVRGVPLNKVEMPTIKDEPPAVTATKAIERLGDDVKAPDGKIIEEKRAPSLKKIDAELIKKLETKKLLEDEAKIIAAANAKAAEKAAADKAAAEKAKLDAAAKKAAEEAKLAAEKAERDRLAAEAKKAADDAAKAATKSVALDPVVLSEKTSKEQRYERERYIKEQYKNGDTVLADARYVMSFPGSKMEARALEQIPAASRKDVVEAIEVLRTGKVANDPGKQEFGRVIDSELRVKLSGKVLDKFIEKNFGEGRSAKELAQIEWLAKRYNLENSAKGRESYLERNVPKELRGEVSRLADIRKHGYAVGEAEAALVTEIRKGLTKPRK